MVAPGMPQNPSVKRWLGDIEPPGHCWTQSDAGVVLWSLSIAANDW